MMAVAMSISMAVNPRSCRRVVADRHHWTFLDRIVINRASSGTARNRSEIAGSAIAPARDQNLKDDHVVGIGRQRLHRPATDERGVVRNGLAAAERPASGIEIIDVAVRVRLERVGRRRRESCATRRCRRIDRCVGGAVGDWQPGRIERIGRADAAARSSAPRRSSRCPSFVRPCSTPSRWQTAAPATPAPLRGCRWPPSPRPVRSPPPLMGRVCTFPMLFTIMDFVFHFGHRMIVVPVSQSAAMDLSCRCHVRRAIRPELDGRRRLKCRDGRREPHSGPSLFGRVSGIPIGGGKRIGDVAQRSTA